MEEALLFTLSTVAQAIAGALALIAAFALYKRLAFENELRENMESAIQPFLADSSIVTHAAHGRYAEVFQDIRLKFAGSPLTDKYSSLQVAHVERMQYIVERRAELTRSLGRSLRLTLVTMCIDIGALALVPYIHTTAWLGNVVLIAAVALFALCVGSYYPLLRSLTE